MATDTITLHVASVDTTPTTPYDALAVSSINGFANHTQCDMKVFGAFKSPILEGDEIQYIDGEISGPLFMRDTFDVKLQPFTYKDSNNDLSTWETVIKPVLRKAQIHRHAWLELTQIGDFLTISQPYHASGSAIPVQLTEMNFEDSEGKKTVTLTFHKTFREV